MLLQSGEQRRDGGFVVGEGGKGGFSTFLKYVYLNLVLSPKQQILHEIPNIETVL